MNSPCIQEWTKRRWWNLHSVLMSPSITNGNYTNYKRNITLIHTHTHTHTHTYTHTERDTTHTHTHTHTHKPTWTCVCDGPVPQALFVKGPLCFSRAITSHALRQHLEV